ncbi:FMN-binding negative transcriptional regulator [Herbaspirillum sp. RV1423]|uniref:FMN-binding negative transcriptional regulator n=1 Tax=Herbaspirillum sp. RV1423 TaxID=1443993 RepID=UPI0004AF11D0|nr:FMN-binding negative transcriptional regulator [Herbaspirillum sp. RV1423]
MYLPSHFAEPDRNALHRLMQENPLSTLTTLTPVGLNADHIPLLLSPDEGEHGVLRGHVARANPLWREYVQATEVLAIFQSADSYISPSWYSTKKEHGKVVPTWNYAVVHAAGPLRVIDDAEWLRGLLKRLTARHESSMPQPWSIEDAPADYIDKMLGAVVGIEIVITRLVGKWKVSQNQPAQNRAGVIDGLRSLERPDAAAMAALVAEKNNKT